MQLNRNIFSLVSWKVKLMSLHCLFLSPTVAFKALHPSASFGRWMAELRDILAGFMRTDSWEQLSHLYIICQWLATVHFSQEFYWGDSCSVSCRLYSAWPREVCGWNLRVGTGAGGRAANVEVIFRAHLGRGQQLVG